MCDVDTSFFILLQHSKPSIPGIITSQIIKSGTYFIAILIPSFPPVAVITLYLSQSNDETRVWISWLSSMTSTSGSSSVNSTSDSIISSSDATSSAVSAFIVSSASSSLLTIGSTTVKAVPFPRSLSTYIVPPCSSTNALERVSPIPEPLG